MNGEKASQDGRDGRTKGDTELGIEDDAEARWQVSLLSQDRCISCSSSPGQPFRDYLPHPFSSGILDISQPSSQIPREFRSRPLENIHDPPRYREERSARWRRVLVISCHHQLVLHLSAHMSLPSRFHLTFLNFSRLISYSAYLKKSSFFTPFLMREVSRCVRRFVIWSISCCGVS